MYGASTAIGSIAGGSPFRPTDSSRRIFLSRTGLMAGTTWLCRWKRQTLSRPTQQAPFVHALTAAAPVVLFSAAAPEQPGTNHINPQCPAYWAGLFAERGHVAIDALRWMIWEDERVGWWYRQNIMIYVARDLLSRWPKLEAMYREGAQPPRLVHPELMRVWMDWGIEQSRLYWNLRSQTKKTVRETAASS